MTDPRKILDEIFGSGKPRVNATAITVRSNKLIDEYASRYGYTKVIGWNTYYTRDELPDDRPKVAREHKLNPRHQQVCDLIREYGELTRQGLVKLLGLEPDTSYPYYVIDAINRHEPVIKIIKQGKHTTYRWIGQTQQSKNP